MSTFTNSISPYQFRKRAEKVWAVSTTQEKEEEEESLELTSESPQEEKVGDLVTFGQTSYLIVDIFKKEIMELGDEVDLNFKWFNKFEVVDGDAPRDHHYFYIYRCYSVCANVEREWKILEGGLALKEKKGVSFFVRTFKERRELMRIAVTVTDYHQNHHGLFFFDVKFPKEYPYRAPSFVYHRYGLPLSSPDAQTQLREKLCYNIFDVFLHIQEIVLMNTNKSCQQMLDLLNQPLLGFRNFVKGYFRQNAPLILRNLMKELDMKKEMDKNLFWKMYIAFEDNKANCQHVLNSDLKEELKKLKQRQYRFSDHYYSFSSHSFDRFDRSDGIKKISKFQSFWNKFMYFD